MAGAFTSVELDILRQDDYYREKLDHCETLTDFELLCDYAFVLLDREQKLAQRRKGSSAYPYLQGMKGIPPNSFVPT